MVLLAATGLLLPDLPTSAVAGASLPSSSPSGAVASEPVVDVAAPHGVVDYWTGVRMRRALPLDLDQAGDLIKPGSTAQRPSARARAAAGRAPRSTGKLFFRTPEGDAVCSAATVNTPRKNVVITAGHCINSGGRRGLLGNVIPGTGYTDFLFVPRYDHDRAPDGRWVATRSIVHNAWVNRVDAYAYDSGLLEMAPRNGRRLVDVVGGNGLAWNFPPSEDDVRIWGWPAETPYDGESAVQCNATTYDAGGRDAGVACPMTGGSSGGPWFIGLLNRNVGHIWAVTSRRTRTGPARLFAVPLSASVRVLLDAVGAGGIALPATRSAPGGAARTALRDGLVLRVDRRHVGRGQLLRMTARTPARARISVDVRHSLRGRWRRVAVRTADGAGVARMTYRMTGAGKRWYRVRSGTRTSAQMRIKVYRCPLPRNRSRAVVSASRCSAPAN